MDNIDHYVNPGDEAVRVNVPLWAGVDQLLHLAHSDGDNKRTRAVLVSLSEGLARAISTVDEPTRGRILATIREASVAKLRSQFHIHGPKWEASNDILVEMVEEVQDRAVHLGSKN